MVVSRALRATGCESCRLSLLKSFTAITEPLPRIKYLNTKLPYPSTAARIRFSSKTAHNGEQNRGFQDTMANEEERDDHIEELVKEKPELGGRSLKVSALPWYLEVNAIQRAPPSLSERQQIPDLPESPPPILESLMQHVSVDLGLDSLTLLDLRKLDPPPALGANLLMLLGTARSEKHLHVSADRLCRWLRSTYKLRPDADGLLGRNELKLKLKRKSKRAKLLGKSTANNDDDAVRTGWVCVDVGVVEAAENSVVAAAEPEGFVGFGRRIDGVRIVVQMLTEEKREQMDLERLWRGILKRGVPAEKETLEDIPSSESSGATTEHTLIDAPRRGLGNAPLIFAQSRGFHTSARHFLEEVRAGEPEEGSGPVRSTISAEKPDFQAVQQFVALSIRSGKHKEAVAYLYQHCNDVAHLQDEGWGQFLLEQLRVYLERISNDQALSDLGQGSTDRDSTPFLKCFYQALSPSLSIFGGEMLIWLQCYGRELGHSGYKLKGLMELFEELQISGVEISTGAYLQLIRSILRPVMKEAKYEGPPRYNVECTMKILQAMYDQGHKILTEDVFVTMQEATEPVTRTDHEPASVYTSPNDTFELPSLHMSAIQRRIHVLMRTVDMPTFSAESRIRLLDLYSRNNHWVEFWDVWRLALRQGQPQTAPLYTFMFSKIAETQHQKACINVLRTWLPDIEREVPAVPLEGEVAEAVKACLLVADPFVERDASDPKAKGEWISVWRKCSAVHRTGK